MVKTPRLFGWRPLITATIAATFGFTPPGLADTPSDPKFEIQTLSWHGLAAEGETVRIHNGFGDVRARFGGYDGEVEVLATAQHFDDEGPRLGLRATASESGPVVTVGFENADGWRLERDPAQKKRIDLVVFIPAQARLDVLTDHGLIEIKGTKSPVTATSCAGGCVAGGTRQFDHEVTAAPDIAVSDDPSAVLLDDAPRRRQTESGAAPPPRHVGMEDRFEFLGIDPRPGVGDVHAHDLGVHRQRRARSVPALRHRAAPSLPSPALR